MYLIAYVIAMLSNLATQVHKRKARPGTKTVRQSQDGIRVECTLLGALEYTMQNLRTVQF
jgi:hypothetical protein